MASTSRESKSRVSKYRKRDDSEKNVKQITLEVEEHLGDSIVRTVSLGLADGLVRGTKVIDTGKSISVPVGKVTLGHVFDVTGHVLNKKDDEKIEAMIKTSDYDEGRFIIMVTKNGKIKRTNLSAYKNIVNLPGRLVKKKEKFMRKGICCAADCGIRRSTGACARRGGGFGGP